MQSTLSGFDDAVDTNRVHTPTDTDTDDRTSITTDPEPSERVLVTGELPTQTLEEIARNITGYFEYLRFEFTADGVTITPFVESDKKEMVSQHTELSRDVWVTYDFHGYPDTDTADSSYTVAVDPLNDLLTPVRSHDSDTGATIQVTVTAGPDTPETQRFAHTHALRPARSHQDDSLNAAGVDVLTIGEDSSFVLRNPTEEPLIVDDLSYHSSMQVTDLYGARSWITDFTGRNAASLDADEIAILVAASTGQRGDTRRDSEYVLTFTAIDTDEWNPITESYTLLSDSDSPELIDADIGGIATRPDDTILHCLPDVHDYAVNLSYGFYRPEQLHSVLKHILKRSFDEHEFTLELTTEFPMEITATVPLPDEDVTREIDVDEINITHMLAPIVTPQ